MAGWKEKREVMKRYDLTAEMYEERYAEEQKAKYKAALENVHVDNRVVLDVGCGTGLFFENVGQKANKVVGVDISRKLLLMAKEKASGMQNVSVLQADADHLPFRGASFHVVFAFTVLQNMPKPYDTINELKRVAELDGKIVVTGLKKAFPINVFMDDIESADLKIVSFVNNEELKCYVVVLAA